MFGMFVWISLGALGALMLFQVLPSIGIARQLRRSQRPLLPDDDCPKAAVVLVLRGADPFLAHCIERLIDLDYPNYDVRIVIDHVNDPAWEIVQEVVERRRPANVRMEALREPLQTCTLNCSSLVQIVSGLDESHEVVAICDADTNPHKSWLRELVTPLVKDELDVVTGQRWYMPSVASVGALVRYVWNAGALVGAAHTSVWGGSCALTHKCLKGANLIDCWRICMGSDAMIFPQIRKHGFRHGFVPSVMMVNRETCSVYSFFQWVQRQVFVCKLYLKTWPLVLIHGILSTVIITSAIVLLAISLSQAWWTHVMWMAAGLGVYALACLWVLTLLELRVRHLCSARGESSTWLTPAAWAKMTVAFPATQYVYVIALLKVALFMRRFQWRGAAYEVKGPWQVRLLKYQPFQQEPVEEDVFASTE